MKFPILLAGWLLLPIGATQADAPADPASSCCADAAMALYEPLMLIQATANLRLVNDGNIDGLRETLQWNIEMGSLAAWSLLPQGNLSPKDRDRAYGGLRLAAVEAELHPVAAWTNDAELQKAFAAALAENPAHAASLRERAKNRKQVP